MEGKADEKKGRGSERKGRENEPCRKKEGIKKRMKGKEGKGGWEVKRKLGGRELNLEEGEKGRIGAQE